MRKYISEVKNQNFVYPNNNPSEYDVTISHEINNNSVSGATSNFSIVNVSASELTIEYNWSWALNGAEPFINQDDEQVFFTVHALPAGLNYYKPWKMVGYYKTAYTGAITLSGSGEITITSEQFNMDNFINGDYYFEFRFIGHRSVFSSTVTLPVSSIISGDPWTLVGVRPASTGIVRLDFTGDTFNCSTISPQYSRDQSQWFENIPSVPYCDSPVYCSHGDSTGTWYFRLRQYLTYGGSIYSNILPYTYESVQLEFVSGATTGNTNEYLLSFTPVDTCGSIIVEWSRNQIDWVGSTSELDCSSSVVIVNTGDEVDIPYWRIKQYTNDTIPTETISNIITYYQ